MSRTLLENVKQFCLRRGLPLPTLVMGSQDDQLLQIVGLANEVLEDLHTRYVGTALQKVATWEQKATESQGTLDALCPFGYKHIINRTFWDLGQSLPVQGPITADEWSARKGSANLGAWLSYRIMGGELLLLGTTQAGAQMRLEYASDWAVKAADGSWKDQFTADTDTCVFPDAIILAGLNWRWRLEKGLKYAEAFREYEVKVAEFNGHDGSKPTLHMDGGCDGVRPFVMMPAIVRST
jgi:hypothetical protein